MKKPWTTYEYRLVVEYLKKGYSDKEISTALTEHGIERGIPEVKSFRHRNNLRKNA